MLSAFGRVLSKDSEYTIGDFAGDCEKNCVCCVKDAQSRDDRCCAFTTVDPNSVDMFDCGHVNEAEMESPQERQRRQIQRWIRKLFYVGMIFWATVGFIAVINPTAIMFNVVVDDEYATHLTEGKMMKQSALEQKLQLEERKKEEELGANVITKFLNKLLRSETASEQDKTAVMHVLELASEKVALAKCETVVITAPIKIYGAACIFYALVCLIAIVDDIPMKTIVTSNHLAWYTCGIIGYALATAGHGPTLQSSSFTFFMLGINVVMGFCWFIMRERIMRYISTVPVGPVDLNKPA